MRTLLFIACMVVPACAYAQASAVITGPEKANLGDLVILSSSGSTGTATEWRLVNSEKAYLALQGQCVFASGTAGNYVFVLSVADCDDLDGASVSVAVHTVTVGNPKPTPGPHNPDVPVIPEPKLPACSKAIFDSMKTVDYRGDEVQTLAKNIKNIAGKAAGLSWTPRQMNEELGKINSSFNDDDTKARWNDWIVVFADCLKDAKKDSQRNEAISIFMEIAEGMEEYLKWKAAGGTTSFSSPAPTSGSLADVLNAMKNSVGGLRNDLNSIKKELGE